MLARSSGFWVGSPVASAISYGRWWFYQDFTAGSGPGITLTDNENGTGLSFSSSKIVNNSAVVTNVYGVPVYTSATPTDTNRVYVSAHSGASVTLSGVPDSSYGTIRIWYLYTESTGSLPINMIVAPQLVQQERAEWLDSNFLNQNLNLSDLPNAGTARTNLGFTNQTSGQVYFGQGGTLPSSSSDLFWDSSNKRLGLATSSPTNRLHLNDSSTNAVYEQFTNSNTGETSTDGLLVGIDGTGNGVIKQQENLPVYVYTNSALVAEFRASGGLLLKTSLLLEDPGAGTNNITLQAPTLVSSYTLTLPTTAGTSGYVLSTDGSGNLSWVTSGGTVLTTKGDLLTYSTTNARLAVGSTFGQVLTVDASQTTGLAWGPVIKAGSATISISATTKAISFSNAMASSSYAVKAQLANYTDANPMRMSVMSIVKTSAGFTVEWENALDSANYVLEWVAIGHTS